MDHTDHVNLLRPGIETPGGVWADLGAGSGAFTLALADLLGPGAEIHAVDRQEAPLHQLQREMHLRFPATKLLCHTADFTLPLDLPPLDSIVMANSLHFQPDPEAVVRHLRPYLAAEVRLLIVEYNVTRASSAVPYPVPYARWQALAQAAGFSDTRLLATRPSRFLHEIYSAVSTGPQGSGS